MKPGSRGWNLKMEPRLRLKVCKLRQGEWNLKMESRLRIKVCGERWNSKMKSKLRLKVCEAAKGVDFKDEV